MASAGPVQIAPVRVDLDGSTRTAVVELSNPGDTPVSMQVDPVSWAQAADGSDRYDSTTEILAFPPIFTIQPGETQIVRVGQTAPQSPNREQAYRLYFTELPSPTTADESSGLRMRVRLGIPVFVAPVAPPRFDLRIVETTYESERLNITLENSGNMHVRVSDFFVSELIDAERVQTGRYVLAGTSIRYSVDVPTGTAISSVQVVTDEIGTTEFDLETGLAIPAEAELASR